MKRNVSLVFAVAIALVATLILVLSVAAQPPAPGDKPAVQPGFDDLWIAPAAQSLRSNDAAKPDDLPNAKDAMRLRERQRLLAAGKTAEAAALAQTGTDRVLVVLVEFAGTDVFTWNPGNQWDPYGIANTAEDAGTAGNCSKIITQTKTFTYTGPLHNGIPTPLSPADRSGESIFTPDFSPQWFTDFMFGNGVVISYTMQDGTPVHESFMGQSVADYYSDLSTGAYTVTGDVIGWLQLPHSTWYYEADQCPGARSAVSYRPSRGGQIPGAGTPRTLVEDALDAVNAISNTIPGFDWHNYDLDGDGVIDRLWIVHAGYGEEDSTTLLNRDPLNGTFYGEAAVWSHSSSIGHYQVAPGIEAGPYIVMPENGGIGVFAHEYGHNLGADDLYSYGDAETSAGFWTLMADDWTGYPIGFEPPAVDPWHLDRWGWLDPVIVNDPTQVYTVTLGQASRFDDNTAPAGARRGVKIALDDQEFTLPLGPIGQWGYWGGAANTTNSYMTTKAPIAIPAAGATLEFQAAWGIETEWDFMFVQASVDGTTWNVLSNTHTTCAHDAGWIGEENGLPADMCAANIGGFTDYNPASVAADELTYETESFDLADYAGQSVYLRFWYMTDWGSLYEGPFVDNVSVVSDGDTLFSDDAETGSDLWNLTGTWLWNDGAFFVPHSFYLQWRNTNENGGYDSALGELRWRYGPANSGLLVWYENSSAYSNNDVFSAATGYSNLTDYPGFGPKGTALVVDSHPDPYRDPAMVAAGYNNEGGNIAHRSSMRDAPFTLAPTADFTMTNSYAYPPVGTQTAQFEGLPAVSTFNDALGYYPGAEYISRGPGYVPPNWRWATKQWDASVVMPSKHFYGIDAPGYPGSGAGTPGNEFRFFCEPTAAGFLACYWFGAGVGLGYDGGNGNPGEVNGQYGWVVELIEEGADHTWATVRIYNNGPFIANVMPERIADRGVHQVSYQVELNNAASITQTRLLTITLDPALTFVSSSLPLTGSGPYYWEGDIEPGGSVVIDIVTSIDLPATPPVIQLQTMIAHDDLMNAPETRTLITQVNRFLFLPMIAK